MTVDLARLPRRDLVVGTLLHRIHLAEHSPWFFSGAKGRFDPVDVPSRGACYWAEDPLGAWVEVFRTVTTIVEDDVARFAVSVLTTARPITVVDLTDRRSLGAGVTAAVGTGQAYGEGQSLASRLQHRVDGVRWSVTHDPAQLLIGIALFGPRGARDEAAFGPTVTAPVSRELVREAEDEFGYRIVSEP